MQVELRLDVDASLTTPYPVMHFRLLENVRMTTSREAEIRALAFSANEAWEAIHDPMWIGRAQ